MADDEEQIGQQTTAGQNAQPPKPTTGPVSPEVQHRHDMQDKADAAIKAAQGSDDITHINKTDITSESLALALSETGPNHFVRIDRKDLTPETAANPLFNEKDAAGNYLPVYVLSNIGNDKPTATLITLENGQRVIFANEGAHQWTEAYVRDNLMVSDADIKSTSNTIGDFLKAGPYYGPDAPAKEYSPEQKQRLQSILDSTSEYAQNMAIGSYEVRIGSDLPSAANAATSKEGHNYIFVDPAALEKALSSDSKMESFKGVMGHEVTHIAQGDTTAAGIINTKAAINNRKEEELADLKGSGPLGTRSPESTAEFFKRDLLETIPAYNKLHPDAQISLDHPSDDDFKKMSSCVTDPMHPLYYDRILALQDEASVIKQYNATHKVETLEDRKTESDFVIKQVMKDMQGKWQLPMPVDVEAHTAPLSTPSAANPGPQRGQTPSGGH